MLVDSPDHPNSYRLLNHVTVDWNIVLTEMNYLVRSNLTAAAANLEPAARSAALARSLPISEQAQSDAWTSSK